MPAFIICFFILILFVSDSSIVIQGASTGLMLWYKNVLPILLPFMLISGIMVQNISKLSHSKNNRHTVASSVPAILTTLFLGVLCGYPLGARTSADFVRNHIYDARTGNILIPLCNNSSPMFIAGYIIHTILRDRLTFTHALFLIYLPYIISIVLILMILKLADLFKNEKKCTILPSNQQISNMTAPENADYMLNTVTQITYIGVYIILCSIIIEYLTRIPGLSDLQAAFLSGITEITGGTYYISLCPAIPDNIKTALILSVTSFGGISAILQTNKVIKDSGLSILYYIAMKIVCAMGTFGLTLLLI